VRIGSESGSNSRLKVRSKTFPESSGHCLYGMEVAQPEPKRAARFLNGPLDEDPVSGLDAPVVTAHPDPIDTLAAGCLGYCVCQ
jgi:hypothetical protein